MGNYDNTKFAHISLNNKRIPKLFTKVSSIFVVYPRDTGTVGMNDSLSP